MFTTLVRDVTRAGRRQLPRRQSARRPRLEALEERCTPSSVGPPGYVLTDLGTLGGTRSNATSINDRGQVVGFGQVVGNYVEHAFLYSDGTIHDLGTLGGPLDFSHAAAVNDRGQVVGDSTTTAPFYGPVHAFLYSGGTMHDLGTLGDLPDSYATGINNRGQVVGYSYNPETTAAGGGIWHAFLYSDGTMKDLGSLGGLGGTSSSAAAINDSGQIVGYSGGSPTNPPHAFLYSDGTMKDLGTLGGPYSTASGINDCGQVVGDSTITTGDIHAFLYSGGTMKDLGTLGGPYSTASGINDCGQVVGTSAITTATPGAPPGSQVRHAFLYSGGTMADLNNLIPADSGFTVTNASAINERGQIAATGFSYDNNGNYYQHALLLTPAGPEFTVTTAGVPSA